MPTSGTQNERIDCNSKDRAVGETEDAPVSLEERRLGSSSIIIKVIRMSPIRKLAAEAADNGLLALELAQGISRVKSVKSTGIRVGNWLSQRQAQALLSAPDITTVSGLRDRPILVVLHGYGLR
jgi:hypothetical protein